METLSPAGVSRAAERPQPRGIALWRRSTPTELAACARTVAAHDVRSTRSGCVRSGCCSGGVWRPRARSVGFRRRCARRQEHTQQLCAIRALLWRRLTSTGSQCGLPPLLSMTSGAHGVAVCDPGVARVAFDVHGLAVWASAVAVYDVRSTRSGCVRSGCCSGGVWRPRTRCVGFRRCCLRRQERTGGPGGIGIPSSFAIFGAEALQALATSEGNLASCLVKAKPQLRRDHWEHLGIPAAGRPNTLALQHLDASSVRRVSQ
jgi:hypothetical protein